MKITKILLFVAVMLTVGTALKAQETKTATIPVSGNCEMCKNKIEKAAKAAGAIEADWSIDEKILTVKYDGASTDPEKIQQKVAAAGYDTRDVKSTRAAYQKLPGCCHYPRKEANADASSSMTEKKSASCCDKENCAGKNEKTKEVAVKANL